MELCRSPAQWLALEYWDRQAHAPAEQDLMMPAVATRAGRGSGSSAGTARGSPQLLTPPREFQRELQILAAIVRLIMHANVRAGLLAARTEQAVLNELGDADRASPSVPPSSLRTVSRRP